MHLYDLIPAAMLAVAVVGIVAALIGRQRVIRWVVVLLILLFVVSLEFPEPPAPDAPYMHWFPASFAVLLVAAPLMVGAGVIGWIVRLAYGASRRRSRTE